MASYHAAPITPSTTNKVRSLATISGVRLPNRPPNTLWDITLSPPYPPSDRHITSIRPHAQDSKTSTAAHPLLLPSLTHPHVHLDKAFILSCLEYADCTPVEGTFPEALRLTSQAKARFTHDDLMKRGNWLIADSVAAGVTAIRAFVEVDTTVGMRCLDAACELKAEWEGLCQIQIVAFAQDPIFSGESGDENRMLMSAAVQRREVEVIGTTPYVEGSREDGVRNVEWAVKKCLELGKHLDFHLDYNVDRGQTPMVWDVLKMLYDVGWTEDRTSLKVMLGHCTRLTLFSTSELNRLANEIKSNKLPVTFVCLPTSDMYMMGRQSNTEDDPSVSALTSPPRATMNAKALVKTAGLDAVLGINNVGNPFTPYGSCDPLSLASNAVGIYHAGTKDDAALLYECVSTRARAAMGLRAASSVEIKVGEPADFLLVGGDELGKGDGKKENGYVGSASVVPRYKEGVRPRPRWSVQEVVWDVPGEEERRRVCEGCLIE